MTSKNLIYYALPLLLILTKTDRSAAVFGIDDAIEIIQLGKAITNSVVEVWDMVEQTNVGQGMDIPFRNQKQKQILKRIVDLAKKVDAVEARVCMLSQNICLKKIHVKNSAYNCENFKKYQILSLKMYTVELDEVKETL